MRLLSYVLIASGLTLLACQSHDPISPSAIDPLQRDWPVQLLTHDYTIQCPPTYQGNGAVGFEGLTFTKYRTDNQVRLSYAFCSSTFCSEYGASLILFPSPIVRAQNTTLDQVVSLEVDKQLIGLFYYTNKEQAAGQLYLLHEGQFKESLQVQYEGRWQAEVLAIMHTIRPK